MLALKKVMASRCGSNDYEYSDSGMTYHDTYFGGTNFFTENFLKTISVFQKMGYNDNFVLF